MADFDFDFNEIVFDGVESIKINARQEYNYCGADLEANFSMASHESALICPGIILILSDTFVKIVPGNSSALKSKPKYLHFPSSNSRKTRNISEKISEISA